MDAQDKAFLVGLSNDIYLSQDKRRLLQPEKSPQCGKSGGVTCAPPLPSALTHKGGNRQAEDQGRYLTRTATQSSEKSREVLLATLVNRTRKFASLKSLALHVRPQVSTTCHYPNFCTKLKLKFGHPTLHERIMSDFFERHDNSSRISPRVGG
jgi:hypothetical protein